MLDLLIHNATLPDGRTDMSLAVQGGRFVEVTPGLLAPAREVVDAGGLLVSPPFVDAHFHMDATLSYGLPRINQSGTLLEGIALWGELKPLLTPEAITERALTYCDWAVGKGLLAIRSHVDTSTWYPKGMVCRAGSGHAIDNRRPGNAADRPQNRG